MRKFYQLIRIDLHSIMDEDAEKSIPVYMPVDPKHPEFSLGYFSSKRKVLDRLIEVHPDIMKNGIMIKPFYTGYSPRGYWEGWLVHDKTFQTAICFMILEIEAE